MSRKPRGKGRGRGRPRYESKGGGVPSYYSTENIEKRRKEEQRRLDEKYPCND